MNEEYIGTITAAIPPKSKTIIMISDFTSDSIGENHEIMEGVGAKCVYKETFSKTGHIKKLISWAIEDSITGKIHKGQKVLDIYVK